MSQMKTVLFSAVAILFIGGPFSAVGQSYPPVAPDGFKRIPASSARHGVSLHIPTKLNRHIGTVQRLLPSRVQTHEPRVHQASNHGRPIRRDYKHKKYIFTQPRPSFKYRHHGRIGPKYRVHKPARVFKHRRGFHIRHKGSRRRY